MNKETLNQLLDIYSDKTMLTRELMLKIENELHKEFYAPYDHEKKATIAECCGVTVNSFVREASFMAKLTPMSKLSEVAESLEKNCTKREIAMVCAASMKKEMTNNIFNKLKDLL